MISLPGLHAKTEAEPLRMRYQAEPGNEEKPSES